MSHWETLGVSLDAFAVALVLGIAFPDHSPRQVCRTVIALTAPSLAMLTLSVQMVEVCREAVWLPPPWLAHLIVGDIGCTMVAGQSHEIRVEIASRLCRH